MRIIRLTPLQQRQRANRSAAIAQWNRRCNAPRVAVMIPHHRGLHPVLNYLIKSGLTYPNYSVHLRKDPQGSVRPDSVADVYRRCSANREALRQEVLCDPAIDWILSLDSDVLPPPDVIERLMRWTKGPTIDGQLAEVVGGWYPVKGLDRLHAMNERMEVVRIRHRQRWVAGVYAEDGSFSNYDRPRDYKLAATHMAPLGCCLIARSLLERCEFVSGCEPGQVVVDTVTRSKFVWGECLAFGAQVYHQGGVIGMAQDVICRHVDLPEYCAA